MTYEQVLKYINDTAVFGSKLGLDNITELLCRLGNPQEGFKSVHIAGSNGKGSVASFISFILAASSYKTGLFTSPPIIDDRERICLVTDTKNEISKDDFALIGEKVINKCLEMVDDGLDHPTQFELYTALAYLYFYEAGVDVAVIEVGLGGRLDATNTITPDLSVICTISLEHTQYLGDTLSKVAYEKGGIIKNGVPVVLYKELPNEARERLLQIADERNSQVYDTANAKTEILSSDFSGTTANIFYDDMCLNSIRISLPGEHQVKNCTLALGAIKALKDKGYNISQSSIIEGIRRTMHKGRCEIVSTSPLVIYDGAHNPECAQALADYVAKNFNGKRKILVFSMLSDKDQYHAACILKNVFDKFIVTHINTSRGESLVKLSELFRECTFVTPAVKAVEYAIQNAEENDVIFVSGSLALIEEINKGKYKE